MKINETLSIDENELRFAYARSSGPGGQNVNKVETKVVLLFDVVGMFTHLFKCANKFVPVLGILILWYIVKWHTHSRIICKRRM